MKDTTRTHFVGDDCPGGHIPLPMCDCSLPDLLKADPGTLGGPCVAALQRHVSALLEIKAAARELIDTRPTNARTRRKLAKALKR